MMVIVKMMLGWEDEKTGEEKRILIHTEVDNSVPRVLHGEGGSKRLTLTAAGLRGLCRFPVRSLLRSLCRIVVAIQPSPCSPTRCRTAPAWEPSLTNGIASEAHDHPPGSVPSGWECWTLNDSDGFRGTEVRPRRGVGWAGWGHASCFAPHTGTGTGSARFVREAHPGD